LRVRRLVVLRGLVVRLVLDILEPLTVRLSWGLAGMLVIVHAVVVPTATQDRLPPWSLREKRALRRGPAFHFTLRMIAGN
jgi:hypothetical protein